MQFERNIRSWSRVVVLSWVSLWMLAASLFHIHPEADHRHGEIGHVHGGTVHTVMSRDLDCEVESHGQFAPESQDAATTVTGLGHRHLEIEFSFLADSADRKVLNPCLIQAHAFVSAEALNPELRVSRARQTAATFSSIRLIHDCPFRGPPDFPA